MTSEHKLNTYFMKITLLVMTFFKFPCPYYKFFKRKLIVFIIHTGVSVSSK